MKIKVKKQKRKERKKVGEGEGEGSEKKNKEIRDGVKWGGRGKEKERIKWEKKKDWEDWTKKWLSEK